MGLTTLGSDNYVVDSQTCSCRTEGDCPRCDTEGLFRLRCPFCKIRVGANPDAQGVSIVKKWIGKHLAQYHQGDMTRIARERKLQFELEEEIMEVVKQYV